MTDNQSVGTPYAAIKGENRNHALIMRAFIASLILLVAALQGAEAKPEVYFSPNGGCTDAIVRHLNSAQSNILVQAYSFTSAPIAKALVDAKKRGVRVAVILDRSQKGTKYSSSTFLVNNGVETYIDDGHSIAHNKVIILDNSRVITGSFNFSKAAEGKNAENVVVLHDKEVASKYIRNWVAHRDHSTITTREFSQKLDRSPVSEEFPMAKN